MDLVEASHRTSSADNRHPWEHARLKVVNDLVKNTIRNSPDFTVLDIGCGDIFFVTALSRLYPETNFVAIDTGFTEEMIAVFRKKIGRRRISLFRDLESAQKQMGKPADLVLLLDVIEHIQDDTGFLRSLRESPAVSQATTFVISVPAYQFLFCSHDRFLGHFRRYTNKSLIRSVEAAGFKKEKAGYFFSSLVLPRALQVLAERMTKPGKDAPTGLATWNRGRLVSRVFRNFLLTDYYLARSLYRLTGLNLPGLSNFLICRVR